MRSHVCKVEEFLFAWLAYTRSCMSMLEVVENAIDLFDGSSKPIHIGIAISEVVCVSIDHIHYILDHGEICTDGFDFIRCGHSNILDL